MEKPTSNQPVVHLESSGASSNGEAVVASGNAPQLSAATANQQQAAIWATLAALNPSMVPGIASTFGLDTNNNSTPSMNNQAANLQSALAALVSQSLTQQVTDASGQQGQGHQSAAVGGVDLSTIMSSSNPAAANNMLGALLAAAAASSPALGHHQNLLSMGSGVMSSGGQGQGQMMMMGSGGNDNNNNNTTTTNQGPVSSIGM